MDEKILKEFKKNIKIGLESMELKELENAGDEAYHWGLTHDLDIDLYQCYDCGCIKSVGFIKVPDKLDIAEYIDNDDEEQIEEILKEVDHELGRDDLLMYLHKSYNHCCGCDECGYDDDDDDDCDY